jgi:uncharacterized protein
MYCRFYVRLKVKRYRIMKNSRKSIKAVTAVSKKSCVADTAAPVKTACDGPTAQACAANKPVMHPAAPVDTAGAEMQFMVEEGRFYKGQPAGLWALPVELPNNYSDDKITLMVRDPYWAYCYWEVTQRKLEMVKAGLGGDGSGASLTLRLYDVTSIEFDGGNAHSHQDLGVYERVGNCYLHIGRPSRSFIVDLGLMSRDGRFITLARSNTVNTPSDRVSDLLDEEWVLPDADFERIFALSGGYSVGHSSADVRMATGQRLQFGVASPGMGSLALMSPIKKQRERGFWFVLNTELIVYGATEPDAKVTVQGSPIKLRPDGTFTMRFALPDGRQVIPVSATSADEVETRWITPKVIRKTD